MHFDKSDLQQLTPEYIARLPPERISILFNQLREDHLRALDRLNQNPTNSSRPPSSQAPWESSSSQEKNTVEICLHLRFVEEGQYAKVREPVIRIAAMLSKLIQLRTNVPVPVPLPLPSSGPAGD